MSSDDLFDLEDRVAELELAMLKKARIPAPGNIKRVKNPNQPYSESNKCVPRTKENCGVWTEEDVEKRYKSWKKDVKSTKGGKRWLAYEGAKSSPTFLSNTRVKKNLEELGEDRKEFAKGIGTNAKDWVTNLYGKGTSTKRKKKKPIKRQVSKAQRMKNLKKAYEDDALLYSQNSRFAGHDEHHEGSYMSVQNITEIAFFVRALFEQIQEGRELPDWVEDKLSHAHAALSDLHRYFSFGRGFEEEYMDYEDEDGFEILDDDDFDF